MKKLYKTITNLCIFCIVLIPVLECAISKNIKPDNDYTEQCTHCHGDRLQGINNVKSYCGQCHDTSVPLSPDKVTDEDRKKALLSMPHIHKTKNLFTGTPSCFYCHKKNDFN
jgi:hypothetical protein